MRSNDGVGGGDAVSAELAVLLARLGELAETGTAVDDGAELVDRIAVLEKVRSAVAAAQHSAMVAFGRTQVEVQSELIAAGRLDPEELGRGIADQVALAAHVSPWQGSRRLGVARTLAADLPATRGLLAAGRISERLAESVVTQTSHLDPEQRRLVDKQLADAGLDELGLRRAEAVVKRVAYEADRVGFTARGRTARKDRPDKPPPRTWTSRSGS